MQFGLWRAAAFVSSPIHLLNTVSKSGMHYALDKTSSSPFANSSQWVGEWRDVYHFDRNQKITVLTLYIPYIILYVSIKSLLILLVWRHTRPKCCNLSLQCKCSASFTNLVARLWTPSINSISFLKCGFYTEQQYSKCGLTRLLYKGINVDCDLSVKFIFIIPNILLAFFTASQHCFSHFCGYHSQ